MPRKSQLPPPIGSPALEPKAAVVRLRELHARLTEATSRGSLTSGEVDTLDFALERTLRDALGANHEDVYRIRNAGYSGVINVDVPEAILARNRASRLTQVAGLVAELVTQFERNIAEAPPPESGILQPSALQHIELLVVRFHQIVKRLRVRHDARPTLDVKDEYDVQDLLHAVLSLHFRDIRAEEWTPSWAGKSSRMDFLLKIEQVVVEVKMTRDGLGEKEVGDQLIVDIGRYQAHPDCKTLVCFVYDPLGRIGNPDGLERDLSGDRDGLRVKVVIAPRS